MWRVAEQAGFLAKAAAACEKEAHWHLPKEVRSVETAERRRQYAACAGLLDSGRLPQPSWKR